MRFARLIEMASVNSKFSFINDLKLARRLDAGDEAAFGEFFQNNYDRLYRFALSRVSNDHAIAEDMVQQAFTNALDGISRYRGEAQLFTWLCTICRNLVTDWQRKNAGFRERVVLIEDAPEIQAVIDSFQAPAIDDPFLQAQRADAARLIQVALDRLPATYGDILEWRYVEGYSAQEIASRLKISVDATNSLTARAKRAFSEIYQPLAEAVVTT
jgi:RNA polymerase sigma-70 factor (ECF subfamily)